MPLVTIVFIGCVDSVPLFGDHGAVGIDGHPVVDPIYGPGATFSSALVCMRRPVFPDSVPLCLAGEPAPCDIVE